MDKQMSEIVASVVEETEGLHRDAEALEADRDSWEARTTEFRYGDGEDLQEESATMGDAVLTALGWLEDETGINADEFLAGWAVFNGLTPHGARWIVNIAYRNNEDWLEDLVRAIGDEAMRSPEIGSVTIYGIVA